MNSLEELERQLARRRGERFLSMGRKLLIIGGIVLLIGIAVAILFGCNSLWFAVERFLTDPIIRRNM